MADDDTEYLKLPVEDRCVHKAWKARVSGYEEAKKIFSQILDEKSPEWNKFLGLMKKMVVDSNVAAQEKGLEAVLSYVENSGVAGKTAGEVTSGLVAKCVAAPKAKTKELAGQIVLMYIEIEKQEIVMDELLKGTEQKNPKIVSGCVNLITQALKEFGNKVISIKPIVKRLLVLLEDRDKTVRDETKALTVEIHRWIGAALSPLLTSLKPVQLTELQKEFDSVPGGKPVPTRYLRSQQAKQTKIADAVEDDEDGEADECDDAAPDVDPYELMTPIDVLNKLPKDWQEKVESKKWQERKEPLDSLDQLLQNSPRLENGDYGDLVRALKKMVTKDSNVVVVALAAKCLAGIANGLKKRFQPYGTACIAGLLEKFKEKKQNVVTALRQAIDAIYASITLEAIQEDVVAALENKNPSVKAETAAFMARCFTKCTPVILNKKLLKAFCTVLLKTLNESDPTVRDASAEALGTAMKVVGEKAILPFLPDIDTLKMAKIKEACDKAELQVKQQKVAKPKATRAEPAAGSKPSAAPKPVKRPASGIKKPGGAAGIKKSATATAAGAKNKPVTERELTPEEVDEKAEALFPPDLLSSLVDTNWKTRMTGVQQFTQTLGSLDSGEASSQLLFRIVNKKPGLKDNNFQVATLKLQAIKTISETFPVTVTGVSSVVTDVVEKLSDAKTQAAAADALTALSEATKLEYVSTQVLDYAFVQKNPKVQVEAFNWLGTAIKEFGLNYQPKLIMDSVKKGVTALNPAVRTAAITFSGLLSVYMGPQLHTFFESEKPLVQQLIAAECDKHTGETPVNPVRGAKQESRRGSVDTVLSNTGEECEEGGEGDVAPAPAASQPTRKVDLSVYITEALVSELSNKDWKVRAEAVQKLQNMVAEHKSLSGGLGDCPAVLAARLVDSNVKITAATQALVQSLAAAMGSDFKQHVRVFFPNCLLGLGDSKSWIRDAALNSINAMGDHSGYREFFENEMIADALKTGSPSLRSELWRWLAEKLPNIKTVPKEELVTCIPTLLANLEDRNPDVRKNASEAVVGIMMHTGYGPLYSACDKLKPGSQGPVKTILEKARGCLPEKPIQKSKSSSNVHGEKGKASAAVAKMGPGSTATFTKSKTKAGAAAKPTGRKKEEEADTSPLLQYNNLKNQRAIDEQKLKTLKWNFITPREEFVELLRDQMTTAGVNKSLISNMFHADFKHHLLAIDALNEDLAMNADAQTANLDLILRWMTLRFFDTNPSVLLKGLEYLQTLFGILIGNHYNMLENEASSFLPYLILKIGDPKDAVRNNVRSLLKQIWSVYPISRLFSYLMDGLKSKNARQRTECLEHMCVLMENFGMSVCQPTPPIALKEIAKQISDRDNSVRNAALMCFVAAYFLDGEKIFKMVGHISDKDMSLLEERIKRAAKNRPVASVKPLPQVAAPRPSAAPAPAPTPAEDDFEEEEEEEIPQPPPPTTHTYQRSVVHEVCPQAQEIREADIEDELESESLFTRWDGGAEPPETHYSDSNAYGPRPVFSGPFGLDPAFLEEIESKPVTCSMPKLKEFDLTFLKPQQSHSQNTFAPKMDVSMVSAVSPLAKVTASAITLEWHLMQIGARDIDKAMEAMQHVDNLLSSEQRNQLHQHEDILVAQLVRQLEFLNQSNHPEVVNCYKKNFSLFLKLTKYPELSQNVKESTLRDVIKTMIILLTEQRLEMLVPGTDMFVRVVNNVVVNVLEKSDHTAIVCGLIKNLYDTVNNPALSTHYQELLMKCIWKVIKFLDGWVGQLHYDLIFVDIHAFLRDYPTSWWKKQASDTPLRTIKTIMHTIVKLNGSAIEEVVRNVRGVTPDSELWTYVQKLLKHIKVAQPAEVDNNPNNRENTTNSRRPNLSKTTHDQLGEIFRKIGKKDETDEGLRLLYEFKQQFPEADINPFLQKSSQFFQQYIERGLKRFETDRLMSGADQAEDKMELEDNDSDQYLQRLRAWQARAGWNTIPASTTRPTPLPLSPPQMPMDDLPTRQSPLNLSGDSVPSDDQVDLEALRRRLEKVRSSR